MRASSFRQRHGFDLQSMGAMTKVTSIDCHARHSFDPKNVTVSTPGVTVSTPNTLLHGVKTVTRMAVNWRHFSHGAHWLGVKTVTFLQVAILLWNFGHNMGSKLWRGWQSTEVTLVMVSIDWESKPWRFGWVTVWDSSGTPLNATIRARKGGQNCDAHEKKLLTCIRASKGSQNRVALFFDLYVAGALLTPTPIATKYSCD